MIRTLGAALILFLSIGCQPDNQPPQPLGLEGLNREATGALGRGEFALLDRLSTQGLAEAERSAATNWIWTFRLLRFEFFVNNKESENALAMLDGDPPEAFRARVWIYQARALMQLREFEAVEKALDAAAKLPLDGDPALPVELDVTRAELLGARCSQTFHSWTGNCGEADLLFQKAYEGAKAANLTRLQAKAAGNQGRLHELAGEIDRATTYFELSLEAAQKSGDKANQVRAKVNLGWCLYRLGSFEKSLEAHNQATALASEARLPDLLASSYGGLGNVYFGRKEYDKALDYYQQALRAAPENSSVPWLSNSASVYIEKGKWSEAKLLNDQALALMEKSGDKRNLGYSLVNAAEIFIGLGKLDEASKMLEELLAREKDYVEEVRWEAHASRSELAVLQGEADSATRNYELALEQIEAVRLKREDFQITFRSKWNHFTQSYVDFLVDQGHSDRALERAESSRAVVLREGLGIRPPTTQKGPPKMPFQSSAKRMKAVLLSYWLAPKRSFLWAVTADRIERYDLPGQEEIESLVDGYQNFLMQSLDPVASNNEYGARLYEILLKPVADLIPAGSNVILVPDGRLHDLNFETLLTDREKPRYWIEDVTLSVTPSLAVLREEPVKRRADRSLLLIGDAPEIDEAFPRLPEARQEIERIANRFPKNERTALVGSAAVPQAYAESDPGLYKLIHFAAHAVAIPSDPLDSSVILAPREGTYRLFARDVETIPLDADVVTLSACQSAGARAYSGEGLVGFAWAFLHAGAHNVVAGLWNVDDRAAGQLMDRFYAAMVAGDNPAMALRRAKLEMIKNGPPYSKPRYWGPFQVYTQYSPFDSIRFDHSTNVQHAE